MLITCWPRSSHELVCFGLLVVGVNLVGWISLVGGCVVVCAVASEAGGVGGVAGVDERQPSDGAGSVNLIPWTVPLVEVSAQPAGWRVVVSVGDAASSASAAPGAADEAASSAGSSDASAASSSVLGFPGTGRGGGSVLALVVVVLGLSVPSVLGDSPEGVADPLVVSSEVASADVEGALVRPVTEQLSDVPGGQVDCALPDDSPHCVQEYQRFHVAGAHLW